MTTPTSRRVAEGPSRDEDASCDASSCLPAGERLRESSRQLASAAPTSIEMAKSRSALISLGSRLCSRRHVSSAVDIHDGASA